MKESDIVLRINKLMDINGLNISQFSYRAGINQSNMSAMLSGKRVIGEGIINKISMSFDIDKKWLISGIGEMKKSIASEALPVYGVPYMMVPFIPVTARAGYLRGFGDQEYIDNLSTIPVMVDKNYRGKYRVFEIEGDSMENSDIKSSLYDNDKYLCREVKRELWDSKLHIKDWYFVIVHKSEGILVKYNYILPRITNEKYNDYLKLLAAGAGINKNVTTHVARHTYATYLLNRGVPVETVSRTLGHTNIKQTQAYARMLGSKVLSDMEVLFQTLDNK